MARDMRRGVKVNTNKRSGSKSRSRSRTTAINQGALGSMQGTMKSLNQGAMGSIPQDSISHADTSMLGGLTRLGATINGESLENITLGQIGDQTQMTHHQT